jgi:N utilization substance protein B
VALQLLFQRDQNPTPVPRSALENFARDRLLGNPEMVAYCLSLYDGTLAHRGEIDPAISATATNWRLSRMQPVDRSVLRMAAYELLFDPDRPPREVVIDEALQLARRFGSADSPAFVNGVIDRIGRSTSDNSEASTDEATPESPDA